MEELKDYLEISIIEGTDTDLNDDIYDIYFKFSQVLTGTKEQFPKWKRGVNVVDSICNDIVGQIYIRRYFSEDDKQECLDLVSRMKHSFEKILRSQQWMKWETRNMAICKLREIHPKIGYPDKFDDLSKLPINKDLSYFDNMREISDFYFNFNKEKYYNHHCNWRSRIHWL